MKTTTAIKALAIAILHFSFSIFNSAAQAAVIDQVIVRQQWPWSTDVKIEYKLSQVTNPVDIAVRAYNGTTPLDNSRIAEALTGNRYGISESGVGTIVLDPVKAFGNEKVAIADFRVELELSESAANIGEVLYKIFDLTNGEHKDVTRAQLLNGDYGSIVTNFSSLGNGFSSAATDVLIWTGVTNNPAYKDTHLVMRKIPAKGDSFMMGSPSGEVGRNKMTANSEDQISVRFTNDYYVAVFELTQAQYRRIANASPSNYTGDDADYHPVEKVSYDTLRGSYTQVGPSGERINWPTNSYMHEVYSGSSMAKLRSKFSNAYEFDLLTEAQWEYACRAKTTTAFSNGKNLETTGVYASANLGSIAWFVSSNEEANAKTNQTHVVGLKAPNAWGLYDMHGNAREVCLDQVAANINPGGLAELVDPPGMANTRGDPYRVVRGGSTKTASWFARSAARHDNTGNLQVYCNTADSFLGVRLGFPVYDAE